MEEVKKKVEGCVIEDSRISEDLWSLNNASADACELSYNLETLYVVVEDLYCMFNDNDCDREALQVRAILQLVERYKELAVDLKTELNELQNKLFTEALKVAREGK